MTILTVRAWFRILRRSAWENDPPDIVLFLRNPNITMLQPGPLDDGIRLASLKDYQAFIDGSPEPRIGRPWRFISSHSRITE